MAGYRSPARKRPIKRICNVRRGLFWGQGKQVEDAVSGWQIPERLTVKQRGRKVSVRRQDGSLDYPDNW